jgi:hypothetical protein
MMRAIRIIATGLALVLPLQAVAQAPIAYPAKGQSQDKQVKDEGECNAWAKRQTGVDPAVLAANPPAQESGAAVGGGERVRGAARGALGGAAIGAIAGDTGKGAGTGAVVGTMAGGHRARSNRDERNAQSQQAHAAELDKFNRAWSACMTGRGYTVS